jgi:hypothetical protein
METTFNKEGELPAPRVEPIRTNAFGWIATPQSSLWIGAIAFIGILYFVGIGVGYLSFVGVLEEIRLRYLLAGIFVVAAIIRCHALIRWKVRPTRMALGMYALFFVTLVIQALWWRPISNAGGEDVYLATIGESAVASGIMAITGEAIGLLWVAGHPNRVLWRVMIGLCSCLLTIGLGVIMGWSTTAEMRLLFQSDTGESVYNYLAIGDSIGLLGLLAIGLVKRPSIRVTALVITAAALFFAYSRTSFFLFLFCAIFALFIGGKHSHRFGIAAVVAIVLFVAIAIAGESDALQPTIERMTVLLFDPEADASYAARKVIMAEGMAYLKENWMMGRFLDEWWREGAAGGYIHNWLSFWQEYGLVPFLASLILFGATGLALWKQLRNPAPIIGTAIALWVYAMLAIITSRGYSWPFLWLPLGIVASVAPAPGWTFLRRRDS